jgi:thiamine-phosphate pyrophosphorylase
MDFHQRRLYLCTGDRPDLESFLTQVLDGGVDIVQLRDKVADAATQLARAELAMEICASYDVPFIMNDRPDLALHLGADGVHVGQDDAPVTLCRRLLGQTSIVGLSTHAREELERVPFDAVTYISAGPVVATPTKPGRQGVGLDYVAHACAASPVPVFVTGGVDAGGIAALADHGVSHFVVVRALTEAEHPFAAASALRAAIDRAISR